MHNHDIPQSRGKNSSTSARRDSHASSKTDGSRSSRGRAKGSPNSIESVPQGHDSGPVLSHSEGNRAFVYDSARGSKPKSSSKASSQYDAVRNDGNFNGVYFEPASPYFDPQFYEGNEAYAGSSVNMLPHGQLGPFPWSNFPFGYYASNGMFPVPGYNTMPSNFPFVPESAPIGYQYSSYQQNVNVAPRGPPFVVPAEYGPDTEHRSISASSVGSVSDSYVASPSSNGNISPSNVKFTSAIPPNPMNPYFPPTDPYMSFGRRTSLLSISSTSSLNSLVSPSVRPPLPSGPPLPQTSGVSPLPPFVQPPLPAGPPPVSSSSLFPSVPIITVDDLLKIQPETGAPLWLEFQLHAELLKLQQWSVAHAHLRRVQELRALWELSRLSNSIVEGSGYESVVEIFGSFMSGLATPMSDVDVLIKIVPKDSKKTGALRSSDVGSYSFSSQVSGGQGGLERNRFFPLLVQALKSAPFSQSVYSIPSARVPLIKLVVSAPIWETIRMGSTLSQNSYRGSGNHEVVKAAEIGNEELDFSESELSKSVESINVGSEIASHTHHQPSPLDSQVDPEDLPRYGTKYEIERPPNSLNTLNSNVKSSSRRDMKFDLSSTSLRAYAPPVSQSARTPRAAQLESKTFDTYLTKSFVTPVGLETDLTGHAEKTEKTHIASPAILCHTQSSPFSPSKELTGSQNGSIGTPRRPISSSTPSSPSAHAQARLLLSPSSLSLGPNSNSFSTSNDVSKLMKGSSSSSSEGLEQEKNYKNITGRRIEYQDIPLSEASQSSAPLSNENSDLEGHAPSLSAFTGVLSTSSTDSASGDNVDQEKRRDAPKLSYSNVASGKLHTSSSSGCMNNVSSMYNSESSSNSVGLDGQQKANVNKSTTPSNAGGLNSNSRGVWFDRNTPIRMDITFHSQYHRGEITTALTRHLLALTPPLGPLTIALKLLLGTAGLADSFTGGLSALGILLITHTYLRNLVNSEVESRREGRPPSHLLLPLSRRPETIGPQIECYPRVLSSNIHSGGFFGSNGNSIGGSAGFNGSENAHPSSRVSTDSTASAVPAEEQQREKDRHFHQNSGVGSMSGGAFTASVEPMLRLPSELCGSLAAAVRAPAPVPIRILPQHLCSRLQLVLPHIIVSHGDVSPSKALLDASSEKNERMENENHSSKKEVLEQKLRSESEPILVRALPSLSAPPLWLPKHFANLGSIPMSSPNGLVPGISSNIPIPMSMPMHLPVPGYNPNSGPSRSPFPVFPMQGQVNMQGQFMPPMPMNMPNLNQNSTLLATPMPIHASAGTSAPSQSPLNTISGSPMDSAVAPLPSSTMPINTPSSINESSNSPHQSYLSILVNSSGSSDRDHLGGNSEDNKEVSHRSIRKGDNLPLNTDSPHEKHPKLAPFVPYTPSHADLPSKNIYPMTSAPTLIESHGQGGFSTKPLQLIRTESSKSAVSVSDASTTSISAPSSSSVTSSIHPLPLSYRSVASGVPSKGIVSTPSSNNSRLGIVKTASNVSISSGGSVSSSGRNSKTNVPLSGDSHQSEEGSASTRGMLTATAEIASSHESDTEKRFNDSGSQRPINITRQKFVPVPMMKMLQSNPNASSPSSITNSERDGGVISPDSIPRDGPLRIKSSRSEDAEVSAKPVIVTSPEASSTDPHTINSTKSHSISSGSGSINANKADLPVDIDGDSTAKHSPVKVEGEDNPNFFGSPLLGRLFLLILRYYGEQFTSPHSTCIDAGAGLIYPVAKPASAASPFLSGIVDPVIIPDPTDTSLNVGRNCFRWLQVSASLKDARASILKYAEENCPSRASLQSVVDKLNALKQEGGCIDSEFNFSDLVDVECTSDDLEFPVLQNIIPMLKFK